MAASTAGALPNRSARSAPNDQPSSHSRGSPAAAQSVIAAPTSSRSVSPPPNWPPLAPRSNLVPLVLNRRTARSASAGSRKDALRSTWLSIMPPAVGSGCRQISVATAGRLSGSASSPARSSPSAVRSVIGSRLAGSTVFAVIWIMNASPVGTRPRARATRTALPARIVPVPALCRAGGLGRPYHDMRDARHDLLVAARAPVKLGGRRAGHLATHPVAARPPLRLWRPEPARRLLRAPGGARRHPPGPARPARDLGRQGARPTGAHGHHHPGA